MSVCTNDSDPKEITRCSHFAGHRYPFFLGCSESATAPDGTGETASPSASFVPVPPGVGLTRHIESHSGVLAGASNFDVTLTCPHQMFAVSGGHDVGADINATQLTISKPVRQPNRWRFLVFNPHPTPRNFEVHVVCLK